MRCLEDQSHGDRMRNGGQKGRGRGDRELVLNGTQSLLGMTKKLRKWMDGGMTVQ